MYGFSAALILLTHIQLVKPVVSDPFQQSCQLNIPQPVRMLIAVHVSLAHILTEFAVCFFRFISCLSRSL